MKLKFFHDDFAVTTLTLLSIFALPLIYLLVVTWPTVMVGITNVLRDRVYQLDQLDPKAEAAVQAARLQMRDLRQRMRNSDALAETSTGLDPASAERSRQDAEAARQQIRELRKKLSEAYPDLPKIMRALRFKNRFLQDKAGQPCAGGTLCGGGEDIAMNSALLFHVVTDELASAFVDQEARLGPLGGFLRLLLPIVLVPALFAILALALLTVIRVVAGYTSQSLSRVLNRMTHAEMTRSALGNDTDGEVALGCSARPTWMAEGFPFLPLDLANKIADYSNQMSFLSLAKFRNAISTLAFSVDEEGGAQRILTTYLTWRELIHTAYFEVAEFRKLLAYAIAQTEGFTPAEAFRADPDHDRTKRWFDMLRLQPVLE